MSCISVQTCPVRSDLLQCCSWAVLPLLYPDVGPDDKLRLDPVHKVLLLILVRCLTSSCLTQEGKIPSIIYNTAMRP